MKTGEVEIAKTPSQIPPLLCGMQGLRHIIVRMRQVKASTRTKKDDGWENRKIHASSPPPPFQSGLTNLSVGSKRNRDVVS